MTGYYREEETPLHHGKVCCHVSFEIKQYSKWVDS